MYCANTLDGGFALLRAVELQLHGKAIADQYAFSQHDDC